MSKEQNINTVVIPVAGSGSRMDPFTRFLPKELLGIGGKPILQIIIDECCEAGIKRFVFVTNAKKGLIARDLIDTNNADLEFIYAIQEKSNGLGDAILRAKSLINEDFFAICLPDEFLFNYNGMKAVVDEFKKSNANILLTTQEDDKDISKYGVVIGNKIEAKRDSFDVYLAEGIVEKPKTFAETNSRRCVIGRYVLSKKIFECLESGKFDKNGEIQLTDSISELLKSQKILNIDSNFNRLDCGSYTGFILANASHYVQLKDKSFIKKLKSLLENE